MCILYFCEYNIIDKTISGYKYILHILAWNYIFVVPKVSCCNIGNTHCMAIQECGPRSYVDMCPSTCTGKSVTPLANKYMVVIIELSNQGKYTRLSIKRDERAEGTETRKIAYHGRFQCTDFIHDASGDDDDVQKQQIKFALKAKLNFSRKT